MEANWIPKTDTRNEIHPKIINRPRSASVGTDPPSKGLQQGSKAVGQLTSGPTRIKNMQSAGDSPANITVQPQPYVYPWKKKRSRPPTPESGPSSPVTMTKHRSPSPIAKRLQADVQLLPDSPGKKISLTHERLPAVVNPPSVPNPQQQASSNSPAGLLQKMPQTPSSQTMQKATVGLSSENVQHDVSSGPQHTLPTQSTQTTQTTLKTTAAPPSNQSVSSNPFSRTNPHNETFTSSDPEVLDREKNTFDESDILSPVHTSKVRISPAKNPNLFMSNDTEALNNEDVSKVQQNPQDSQSLQTPQPLAIVRYFQKSYEQSKTQLPFTKEESSTDIPRGRLSPAKNPSLLSVDTDGLSSAGNYFTAITANTRQNSMAEKALPADPRQDISLVITENKLGSAFAGPNQSGNIHSMDNFKSNKYNFPKINEQSKTQRPLTKEESSTDIPKGRLSPAKNPSLLSVDSGDLSSAGNNFTTSTASKRQKNMAEKFLPAHPRQDISLAKTKNKLGSAFAVPNQSGNFNSMDNFKSNEHPFSQEGLKQPDQDQVPLSIGLRESNSQDNLGSPKSQHTQPRTQKSSRPRVKKNTSEILAISSHNSDEPVQQSKPVPPKKETFADKLQNAFTRSQPSGSAFFPWQMFKSPNKESISGKDNIAQTETRENVQAETSLSEPQITSTNDPFLLSGNQYEEKRIEAQKDIFQVDQQAKPDIANQNSARKITNEIKSDKIKNQGYRYPTQRKPALPSQRHSSGSEIMAQKPSHNTEQQIRDDIRKSSTSLPDTDAGHIQAFHGTESKNLIPSKVEKASEVSRPSSPVMIQRTDRQRKVTPLSKSPSLPKNERASTKQAITSSPLPPENSSVTHVNSANTNTYVYSWKKSRAAAHTVSAVGPSSNTIRVNNAINRQNQLITHSSSSTSVESSNSINTSTSPDSVQKADPDISPWQTSTNNLQRISPSAFQAKKSEQTYTKQGFETESKVHLSQNDGTSKSLHQFSTEFKPSLKSKYQSSMHLNNKAQNLDRSVTKSPSLQNVPNKPDSPESTFTRSHSLENKGERSFTSLTQHNKDRTHITRSQSPEHKTKKTSTSLSKRHKDVTHSTRSQSPEHKTMRTSSSSPQPYQDSINSTMSQSPEHKAVKMSTSLAQHHKDLIHIAKPQSPDHKAVKAATSLTQSHKDLTHIRRSQSPEHKTVKNSISLTGAPKNLTQVTRSQSPEPQVSKSPLSHQYQRSASPPSIIEISKPMNLSKVEIQSDQSQTLQDQQSSKRFQAEETIPLQAHVHSDTVKPYIYSWKKSKKPPPNTPSAKPQITGEEPVALAKQSITSLPASHKGAVPIVSKSSSSVSETSGNVWQYKKHHTDASSNDNNLVSASSKGSTQSTPITTAISKAPDSQQITRYRSISPSSQTTAGDRKSKTTTVLAQKSVSGPVTRKNVASKRQSRSKTRKRAPTPPTIKDTPFHQLYTKITKMTSHIFGPKSSGVEKISGRHRPLLKTEKAVEDLKSAAPLFIRVDTHADLSTDVPLSMPLRPEVSIMDKHADLLTDESKPELKIIDKHVELSTDVSTPDLNIMDKRADLSADVSRRLPFRPDLKIPPAEPATDDRDVLLQSEKSKVHFEHGKPKDDIKPGQGYKFTLGFFGDFDPFSDVDLKIEINDIENTSLEEIQDVQNMRVAQIADKVEPTVPQTAAPSLDKKEASLMEISPEHSDTLKQTDHTPYVTKPVPVITETHPVSVRKEDAPHLEQSKAIDELNVPVISTAAKYPKEKELLPVTLVPAKEVSRDKMKLEILEKKQESALITTEDKTDGMSASVKRTDLVPATVKKSVFDTPHLEQSKAIDKLNVPVISTAAKYPKEKELLPVTLVPAKEVSRDKMKLEILEKKQESALITTEDKTDGMSASVKRTYLVPATVKKSVFDTPSTKYTKVKKDASPLRIIPRKDETSLTKPEDTRGKTEKLLMDLKQETSLISTQYKEGKTDDMKSKKERVTASVKTLLEESIITKDDTVNKDASPLWLIPKKKDASLTKPEISNEKKETKTELIPMSIQEKIYQTTAHISNLITPRLGTLSIDFGKRQRKDFVSKTAAIVSSFEESDLVSKTPAIKPRFNESDLVSKTPAIVPRFQETVHPPAPHGIKSEVNANVVTSTLETSISTEHETSIQNVKNDQLSNLANLKEKQEDIITQSKAESNKVEDQIMLSKTSESIKPAKSISKEKKQFLKVETVETYIDGSSHKIVMDVNPDGTTVQRYIPVKHGELTAINVETAKSKELQGLRTAEKLPQEKATPTSHRTLEKPEPVKSSPVTSIEILSSESKTKSETQTKVLSSETSRPSKTQTSKSSITSSKAIPPAPPDGKFDAEKLSAISSDTSKSIITPDKAESLERRTFKTLENALKAETERATQIPAESKPAESASETPIKSEFPGTQTALTRQKRSKDKTQAMTVAKSAKKSRASPASQSIETVTTALSDGGQRSTQPNALVLSAKEEQVVTTTAKPVSPAPRDVLPQAKYLSDEKQESSKSETEAISAFTGTVVTATKPESLRSQSTSKPQTLIVGKETSTSSVAPTKATSQKIQAPMTHEKILTAETPTGLEITAGQAKTDTMAKTEQSVSPALQQKKIPTQALSKDPVTMQAKIISGKRAAKRFSADRVSSETSIANEILVRELSLEAPQDSITPAKSESAGAKKVAESQVTSATSALQPMVASVKSDETLRDKETPLRSVKTETTTKAETKTEKTKLATKRTVKERKITQTSAPSVEQATVASVKSDETPRETLRDKETPLRSVKTETTTKAETKTEKTKLATKRTVKDRKITQTSAPSVEQATVASVKSDETPRDKETPLISIKTETTTETKPNTEKTKQAASAAKRSIKERTISLTSAPTGEQATIASIKSDETLAVTETKLKSVDMEIAPKTETVTQEAKLPAAAIKSPASDQTVSATEKSLRRSKPASGSSPESPAKPPSRRRPRSAAQSTDQPLKSPKSQIPIGTRNLSEDQLKSEKAQSPSRPTKSTTAHTESSPGRPKKPVALRGAEAQTKTKQQKPKQDIESKLSTANTDIKSKPADAYKKESLEHESETDEIDLLASGIDSQTSSVHLIHGAESLRHQKRILIITPNADGTVAARTILAENKRKKRKDLAKDKRIADDQSQGEDWWSWLAKQLPVLSSSEKPSEQSPDRKDSSKTLPPKSNLDLGKTYPPKSNLDLVPVYRFFCETVLGIPPREKLIAAQQEGKAASGDGLPLAAAEPAGKALTKSPSDPGFLRTLGSFGSAAIFRVLVGAWPNHFIEPSPETAPLSRSPALTHMSKAMLGELPINTHVEPSIRPVHPSVSDALHELPFPGVGPAQSLVGDGFPDNSRGPSSTNLLRQSTSRYSITTPVFGRFGSLSALPAFYSNTALSDNGTVRHTMATEFDPNVVIPTVPSNNSPPDLASGPHASGLGRGFEAFNTSGNALAASGHHHLGNPAVERTSSKQRYTEYSVLSVRRSFQIRRERKDSAEFTRENK